MFNPPECNIEIPKPKGTFGVKEEDEISNIQKGTKILPFLNNKFFNRDFI